MKQILLNNYFVGIALVLGALLLLFAHFQLDGQHPVLANSLQWFSAIIAVLGILSFLSDKPVLLNLKYSLFRIRFRMRNRHNSTVAASLFPLGNVVVGKKTYGPLNIVWMASQDAMVHIGNYCSIGPGVTFLVGGSHDYRRVSTYPFQSLVYGKSSLTKTKLGIVIEDDVWIGYEAFIMSGVRIGKGSVIGARSIVTKDVPPYSVFIGNKVYCKRFPDDIVAKVENIDFATVSHVKSDAYDSMCMQQVDADNVDAIIKAFIAK
mgnify:CR=1 FL=1